jgi:hypothetical protein
MERKEMVPASGKIPPMLPGGSKRQVRMVGSYPRFEIPHFFTYIKLCMQLIILFCQITSDTTR